MHTNAVATVSAEQDHASLIRTLIPNRLAFISGHVSVAKMSAGRKDLKFVTSDLHTRYFPFAADFGPVNLGIVYRFCVAFSKKLMKIDDVTLVYCIENQPESQANASFLLGALLVVMFSWTPEEASEPFTGRSAPFTLKPFHDATFAKASYPLSLVDCLRGISKSMKIGWFDPKKFDIEVYEHLDNPLNGDIHMLCPKIIGFKGPLSNETYLQKQEVAFPPEHYATIFRELGVTSVVRLNDPDTYDAAAFEKAGIKHHDLFFNDCTVPPEDIVERFLNICDESPGVVAVHCRAGLGRTGTLAALWMMKHAGFGADEAIGWLRIVRPGSVIGPQQEYLKACDGRRWRGNTLLPASSRGPLPAFRSLLRRATVATVGVASPPHAPPPPPPPPPEPPAPGPQGQGPRGRAPLSRPAGRTAPRRR
jgi:cell division cycle 14